MKAKINKLLTEKLPMVPQSDIDQTSEDIMNLIKSILPSGQTIIDETIYNESEDPAQSFFNGAYFVIDKFTE